MLARPKRSFTPIVVNGKPIDVVSSAKVLGVNISQNLKWNIHISEIVKKVSSRLYIRRTGNDLHVSLHKGFKIRFAGIVPVSLEFTGGDKLTTMVFRAQMWLFRARRDNGGLELRVLACPQLPLLEPRLKLPTAESTNIYKHGCSNVKSSIY